MQTFSQSIERLVETGLIRSEDASRELERLGAVASPRIGTPPAAAKPAAMSPPASGRSSGETAAAAPAEPAAAAAPPAPPQSGDTFGEEDTLMNWL